MKKSEFICLILPLLAPMQNLEGGSQRGDDPEKSSSTADGAAKPRQKCLTVQVKLERATLTVLSKTIIIVVSGIVGKNVSLGFFFLLLLFVTLI